MSGPSLSRLWRFVRGLVVQTDVDNTLQSWICDLKQVTDAKKYRRPLKKHPYFVFLFFELHIACKYFWSDLMRRQLCRILITFYFLQLKLKVWPLTLEVCVIRVLLVSQNNGEPSLLGAILIPDDKLDRFVQLKNMLWK